MNDNKDRDMFYSNYGYAGMMPNQGMMMPSQGMLPNQGMMMPSQGVMPNQMNNNMGNYENRISNLEKQVSRLNARVSRLEGQYGGNTTNIYNNEPDSNMYMI